MDAKIAEMVEEMADGPGHPTDVSNEEQQIQGGMPPTSTNMEDEVLLEEGPNGSTEARMSTRGTRDHYIRTPYRPRREKRRGDPDDMDEDVNKTWTINSETEEGDDMSSIPVSSDD